MKALKILVVLALVYVALVAAFESLIGVLQPMPEATIVITTFDADGTGHDRVVSSIETDGALYVAANHWPRAWYRRALENPRVQATQDGQAHPFRAVPVSGEEFARVDAAQPLPGAFRFLTGYPPRRILRLEPR